MAKLDRGEFDFSLPPALGGPTAGLGEDIYTAPLYGDLGSVKRTNY